MSMRTLCEQFLRWREQARPMVLATVIGTAGSTYSKAGAQMLIAKDDGYRGLLSGGCLEGDLTAHGERCLASGQPLVVSYDMRNRDEDEIWGLGLGCDGALDILLQPLTAEQQWQPFGAIADAAMHGKRAAWGLVIKAAPAADEGPSHGLLASSLVLIDPASAGERALVRGDLDDDTVAQLRKRCRDVALAGGVEQVTVPSAQGSELEALVAEVIAPIRLLVVGAGPDTVPVLRMARELGWYVTQADHRPGNLAAAAEAAPADQSVEVTPGRLREHLDLDAFDAVVIMSHHLASDRAYLQELALSEVPFIGLLGPAARRRRLLTDVAEHLADGDRAGGLRDARALTARTHGPVGLDLGSREPAGIALSIVAQVQQFHARNA